MQHLSNLFQISPRVAGWVSYSGSERAGRIGEDGVIGKNNQDWQAGLRPDYYIEAQRVGYQVVLGGLAGGDMALVDRGLRAIEWGYRPDVLGPANDWSQNRDFDSILAHAAHPRTMFGAASVKSIIAILESETLPTALRDRAMHLVVNGVEQSAAAYIASGDAAMFRTECTNSSQISFQATWMQGAYVLTGDETYKTEAKETIRQMMDLQLDSGAFGEQGAYDTSYAVQTLRELVVYRDMLNGAGGGAWHTQVSDFITRGANWLLDRISPNGEIKTVGNSRTAADGEPLKGDFAKGWDLDQVAITLAQYASAFGRWDELEPVINAVQYRGQEYDHISDVVPPTV